ncbi:hypothetical protein IWX50DRAFT_311529 [Phyllosticta citricarpa]
MGYADKDYNLQEVISMGFYCLVGTGVIVHWIHVWLGKPDHRVRELEARLRSLEEGDRIRDKFALASMGGYPQSVTSSRRGSTTACNTVAGGNNSIFAESLFQATPSKRLRADSYFTTAQHGCPPSENVSPHDTTTPPPLAFPKPPPPPPSKASQPPSPLCRSPVSPTVTAGGPPPGQAFSCPDPAYNNSGAETNRARARARRSALRTLTSTTTTITTIRTATASTTRTCRTCRPSTRARIIASVTWLAWLDRVRCRTDGAELLGWLLPCVALCRRLGEAGRQTGGQAGSLVISLLVTWRPWRGDERGQDGGGGWTFVRLFVSVAGDDHDDDGDVM